MDSTEGLQEKLLDHASPLSLHALLDAIEAIVEDVNLPALRASPQIKLFLDRYKSVAGYLQEQRVSKSNFEMKKPIGQGAFGTVKLARDKKSDKIVAVKILNKSEIIRRAGAISIWEEREVLAKANSEWVVQMHYAFQDRQHLYMVMDFVPGGDLVSYLETHDFPEDWARFYGAEILLGIDAIHSLGFAHRDVKPDNVLLDARGHAKLADFGTCARLDSHGMVVSCTSVGTPDYISPEVLRAQEDKIKYGKECDYWSFGVVLFELLTGYLPFDDDSVLQVYAKILRCKPEEIEWPEDIPISSHAKDLVCRLLTKKDTRLGRSGVSELFSHPFFTGIEWAGLRNTTAPIMPDLSGPEDTRHFPESFDSPPHAPVLTKDQRDFEGNQLPFIGFSFTKDLPFSDASVLSAVSSRASSVRPHSTSSMQDSVAREVSNITLQASIDNLMNKLKEREREMDGLQKQCTQWEQQARSAHQERNSMEQTVALLTEKMDQLQRNAEMLVAKATADKDMELQLERVKVKQLEEHVAELEHEKEQVQKTMTTSHSDAASAGALKFRIQVLNARIRKVTAEQESQRIRADNLLAENNTLSSTLTKVNQAMSALKMASISEKQALDAELQKVIDRRTQLAAELDVANRQLAETKQQLEAMTLENNHLGAEVTHLEEEVEMQRSLKQQHEAKLVAFMNRKEEKSDVSQMSQELEATVTRLQKENKLLQKANSDMDILLKEQAVKSEEAIKQASRDAAQQFARLQAQYEEMQKAHQVAFEQVKGQLDEQTKQASKMQRKATRDRSAHGHVLQAELNALRMQLHKVLNTMGESTPTGGDTSVSQSVSTVPPSAFSSAAASPAPSQLSSPRSSAFFGDGSDRSQRRQLEKRLHEQERLVKTLKIHIHKLEHAKHNNNGTIVDVVTMDSSDV